MFQDVESGDIQSSIDGDYLNVDWNPFRAIKRAATYVGKEAKQAGKFVGKEAGQAGKFVGKEVAQAGKFVGKKVKGFFTTDIVNLWHKFKTIFPLCILMRGAFQGLLRLNIFGLATDLKALKDKGDKGDKSSKDKYEKARNEWYAIGGDRTVFDHTVQTGTQFKPLLHSMFKADGEYFNLAPAVVPAMITASAPILVATINIVGKNKNVDDATYKQAQADAASQKDAVDKEKDGINGLSSSDRTIFEDADGNIIGEDGNLTAEATDALSGAGGKTDASGNPIKDGGKSKPASFPVWGYAAIGGGVLVLLVTIILVTRNKS